MPDEVAVVAPETPAEVVSDQKPVESAPADQPTGETVATEKTPETKPPEKVSQSRFDRKINKLYRERAEEKARADLLERQLNELRPKAQLDASAPRLEQFDYDAEKYAEALAEHKISQERKANEKAQAEHAQKAIHEKLTSDWESQVAKAEEKYEDFHDVVGELSPSAPWAVALMTTENGADVAMHLGKNFNEAKRIASLPPHLQFIEIGKLSARIEAKPIEPKKPSSAPAPIKPLGGSSSPTAKKLSDIDDFDEFAKRRKEQIAARR